MDLSTPIDRLPKTAAITIQRMRSAGIKTYWDLLNYFPSRYNTYIPVAYINEAVRMPKGRKITLQATVESAKTNYTRRRFTLQKVVLKDTTGNITCTWFNQPYLMTLIKPGMMLGISGEIKQGELYPEEYEILNGTVTDSIHTRTIVPVYPQVRGLSSRTIRDKVWYIVKNFETSNIEKMVPAVFEKKNDLLDQTSAYKAIHFPDSVDQEKKARRRLSFDEFFTITLSSQLVKEAWQKEKVTKALSVKKYKKQIDEFVGKLPFKLTTAQKRSIEEIFSDFEKTVPMNRLLQGDVGSGKTVVSALACYVTFLNGFKSLFMAPTEILATQHILTLEKLFASGKPRILLVTGTKKPKKNEIEDADIIVGTHALISQAVVFENVAFCVVDEQHKFGVAQRAALKEKGVTPHLLSMTATPIPRTVSLTLYGELDISLIDEMPKGRLTTKTYLTPQHKRNDGYEWIKQKIRDEKEQVFIVCPLIDESEVETIKTVKAATVEFETLQKKTFAKQTLGLLHGKMKSAEKDEVMQKFAKGDLDILVSTPVVEVGVDIPNANIIIIEAAERFGLAQLHQLRGRVGRSDKQAFCLLFTGKTDAYILDRLRTFTKISNGFELAEYDLKRRGVGEMYGTKQHGISDLKIASFTDSGLIQQAARTATEFMKSYNVADYPQLKSRLDLHNTFRIARD